MFFIRVFFSFSDDYSGEHVGNATILCEFLGTITAPVMADKYVLIGIKAAIFKH